MAAMAVSSRVIITLNESLDIIAMDSIVWSTLPYWTRIELYFCSSKIGNDCLRNLKCSCGRRGRAPQSPQQVNCGQYLQGECISNVVYQCRLIGPPVPLQYCPHGCINGKCSPAIIEVTLEDKFGKEVDKPPSESQRSGRHPTDRNKKPSTTNGTSENHEVEFVTFASLIRIPLFNP